MAEEHNIPKTYDPASVEKKWYQFWEKNKLPLSFRLPILRDSCTWGMPWTTRCRIS